MPLQGRAGPNQYWRISLLPSAASHACQIISLHHIATPLRFTFQYGQTARTLRIDGEGATAGGRAERWRRGVGFATVCEGLTRRELCGIFPAEGAERLWRDALGALVRAWERRSDPCHYTSCLRLHVYLLTPGTRRRQRCGPDKEILCRRAGETGWVCRKPH